MCTYLDQVGHTYYFRRGVPADLRATIRTATGAPRSEWKFSLKTKDRETAKRLITPYTIDTNEQIDRARDHAAQAPGEAAGKPSGRSPWASEAAMEHDAERDQDDAERDARWEAREPLRRQLETAMRKSTLEITPREAAMRDLLRDQAHEFTVAAERQITRQVARAMDRRGKTLEIDAPAPSTASGIMLHKAVVDRWAAERKVMKKGEDAHRRVAEWFYERVGSKPIDQITRKDVLAFKDKLLAEGATHTNINVKLSRLRTLLQWAADNELVTDNVAKGISLKDTDRAKNKRREFDLASLRSIFASPVFAGGSRPTQGRGEAAYWLPLLALYSGARLEELGQLRPEDVALLAYPDQGGIEQQSWFIRIREDQTDDMRLKNAHSERNVPVHSELARLGFLALVEAATKAGDKRLFPLLKPNVYGTLTAKWGEWFGPYLRAVCGVTDTRLVFHSFRHTFKQYARHAGIDEGIQRQIMGHSSSDVADQYGSGYPLHQVVAGMSRYGVPGLTI